MKCIRCIDRLILTLLRHDWTHCEIHRLLRIALSPEKIAMRIARMEAHLESR